MSAEHDGRVIATARYCEGAPDDGRGVWAVSGWPGRLFTRNQVEQGGEATMRLITNPALDAVTGQFFDGLRTSRALPQAYDPQFRTQLGEATDRMLSQAA